MNEPEHTVVIVGAGPTGRALGAELKRLGIASLILDRLEAGANKCRLSQGPNLKARTGVQTG
jgi:2-polyprenyl-6-methoxyphenol hydroxylase-like FAD-dependent oxidoreductase